MSTPSPISGCAQTFETPRSADGFVDSIGINIHLHNENTPYGNFPVILKALADLGVRHTRDGLINTTWEPYYERHSTLASQGIHTLLVTSPEDTDEQIVRFLKRVGGAVEGLEAPNEYDQAGEPRWAEKLTAFMPRLKRLAPTLQPVGRVRVVGPALLSALKSEDLDGLQSSFDDANMHNYFGGHHPGTAGWGNDGYGSIAWNLGLARTAWPGKPIVTTETGYLTDPATPQAITEEAQAQYTPRIFLEQEAHGIHRTYLYELSDENAVIPLDQRSFGLLRQDGSRKPAFVALARLIELLADSGQSVLLKPLPLQVAAADAEVHHMLFQKKDGTYSLAVWLETSCFDQATRLQTSVRAVPVTIESPGRKLGARLFSLDPSMPATAVSLPAASRLQIAVTGHVQLLQLSFVAGRVGGGGRRGNVR